MQDGGANLGNNGKETKETMANPSESSSQTVDNSATVNAIQTSISPSEEENLSSIETTYTLTSGHYFAGTDIPIGKCNVTAIDGSGNLSSTNLFNGGVNEMFGVDDGSGFYTSNFNGLKLPMDTVLNVSGGLTIKLEYTSIDGGFSGRIYNDANAITLTSGNYEAGTDFSEGIYKVVAVSGSGNLSSSNLFDGGVNEMFGVDDGSGLYTQDFINVVLSKKVELTVTGGLKIKLIPATSP